MKRKKCRICKRQKLLHAFNKITGKPYYLGECKACRNKRMRIKFADPKNKERRALYAARYYHRPGVKEIQRSYAKKWYKKNKDRVRGQGKIYNIKAKTRAVEYKGGKCVCCGYNKCISALDFHHINPIIKSGNSTTWLKWPWDKARSELDECVLVCSNCHREIHAGLITNLGKYSFGMKPVSGYSKRRPKNVHKRFSPWSKFNLSAKN